MKTLLPDWAQFTAIQDNQSRLCCQTGLSLELFRTCCQTGLSLQLFRTTSQDSVARLGSVYSCSGQPEKTLLPDRAQFTAVQDNQSRLCCQTGLSLELFRTTSQDSVARLGSVYSYSGHVARLGSVYSCSGQPVKTLLPDWAQFTAVQDNQSRLCCQTGLSLQLFRTTSQDSVARLGSVYSCSGQPVKTLLPDWAQFTAVQDNQSRLCCQTGLSLQLFRTTSQECCQTGLSLQLFRTTSQDFVARLGSVYSYSGQPVKTLLPDWAQFTAIQDNQSRLCCQTGLSLQLFRTTIEDSVARLGSVYSCSGQPVKTLLPDWAQFTAIQDNQ